MQYGGASDGFHNECGVVENPEADGGGCVYALDDELVNGHFFNLHHVQVRVCHLNAVQPPGIDARTHSEATCHTPPPTGGHTTSTLDKVHTQFGDDITAIMDGGKKGLDINARR